MKGVQLTDRSLGFVPCYLFYLYDHKSILRLSKIGNVNFATL